MTYKGQVCVIFIKLDDGSRSQPTDEEAAFTSEFCS